MRSGVVVALVACVGLLLQSSVLPGNTFGWIVPDVLLVLCVYLGLNQHTVSGAVGAFALGYLEGAASGSPAGLNSCGMLVVYMLVYLTCRRLWVDNAVSKVVVVFLASLVNATVVVVPLAFFSSLRGEWPSITGGLVTQAALTAAVAPAVFWLLANTGIRSHRESE